MGDGMSYGKVNDAFWESRRIDTLSDRAALLGLFLITGPHRNAIGCFRLGIGAITDEPRFKKWGIEGVYDALSELLRMGFIVRDEATDWTFITNHLKHDPIKGGKAAIHALGLANRVPQDSPVYRELKQKLEPQLQAEAKVLEGKDGWPMPYPLDTPCDTPSNGDAIPKPSPLPIPIPKPAPCAPRDVVGLLHSACSEAGIDQGKAVNWLGIGQGWLALGLPDERVLAVIREVAARPGYKPPGTLAYFTPMLTEAAMAPQPQKPAELTPEERAKLPWRYVRAYKRDGQWRGEGPPPGSKGCTVDPAILREFGYEVVP
jgi:hypothetical protein